MFKGLSAYGGLKFTEIKDLYDIALNRILLKQKAANTLLLDFVAVVTKKIEKEVLNDTGLVDKLLLLLMLYYHDDLRNYEFEVVDATLSFRIIANVLRDADKSDQYVDWWLYTEENNRYNFFDVD